MIRIQKRLSKLGETVYRVHKHGTTFYFWHDDYSRAGAFAMTLWKQGDLFNDDGR
ncbi:MAG TPA: hypothetical protein VMW36_08740 [Patescibacteria group bacterium]|nr:hypothetical protein [Patescibacteria group bacterium]